MGKGGVEVVDNGIGKEWEMEKKKEEWVGVEETGMEMGRKNREVGRKGEGEEYGVGEEGGRGMGRGGEEGAKLA